MRTLKVIFSVVALCFCLLATAEIDPLAAQEAASGYNHTQAVTRIESLRGTNWKFEESRELERMCDQAVVHEDVDVLLRLTSIGSTSIQGYTVKQIKLLPVPLRKQAVVSVLRDHAFWNYDPVKQRYTMRQVEGQSNSQLVVRRLAGDLLGRDLRKESKYYDPDPRKQQVAEDLYAPAILDPATREQLVQELLIAP